MAGYEKPLPNLNESTGPFWDYCKKRELRMQKCAQCGHLRYPPSIICPKCHSMEAEWARLSGKGKVYSFAVFHQVYHKGFANDIPYAVAIIELDEGPRMLSNVSGRKPEDLTIDMPVEVYFEDVTEEFALPKFRPAMR